MGLANRGRADGLGPDSPSVRVILLGIMLGALVGCGPAIHVRRIDDSSWFELENRNALDSDGPSERTKQFLRREALYDRFREDELRTVVGLHRRLVNRRERRVAFHLAELCYLQAKRARRDGTRRRMYLSAAEYAYAALFDKTLSPVDPNPFDPAFTWCCDLYNRSLAGLVRYRNQHSRADDGKQSWLALSGDFTLSNGVNEFSYEPDEYDEVFVAFDYEVVGLPATARSYGIGVPLVVTRRPLEESSIEGRHRVVQENFGATVVLHFAGSIVDRARGLDREISLDVHDPLSSHEIEISGRRVPLSLDVTTPLAHMLGQLPSANGGLRGMLNPQADGDVARLILMEPYKPYKIPVVFVHGLMSSPLTWMALFNDVLADPELRRRYQFWFFRYPTGNPILYSGSLLRKSLEELAEEHDPEGESATFQNMVVCGHSMGGLLTRLLLHSSGDRLWRLVSTEPFDEIVAELGYPEVDRESIRDAIFFDRLPFVERVVFMAVPHRGSDLALSWFGRVAARMIDLRSSMSLRTQALRNKIGSRIEKRLNVDLFKDPSRETGVGNLAPDDKVQSEVRGWEYPKSVPIHSIIGNRAGRFTGGSDGVVEYSSSHLDGAVSEKVINSGHGVQATPEAALEVRRILHLHLDETDRRTSSKE